VKFSFLQLDLLKKQQIWSHKNSKTNTCPSDSKRRKILCHFGVKVKVLVVDNLKNLGANGEEYKEVEIFPSRKIGNMGLANFSEFYSPKLILLWILGTKKCDSLVANV